MRWDELFRVVLAAADDGGRVFNHTEMAIWPPGSAAQLHRLGLIRRASGCLHAPCPNCPDGYIEPVTVRRGVDHRKRFFIWCPEAMRIEVEPRMCQGWEVDPDGLVGAIAESLGLTGHPRPVLPQRFWRLGRTSWPPGSGVSREVVFARGLHRGDAATVAALIGAGGRAIVLVPQHVPDERTWPGAVPALIPLTEVLTWEAVGPVLDVMAMVDRVEAADRLAAAQAAVALGPAGKQVVRRQVKAEIKSLLSDDAYLAAYREHGSFRKAADALTQQTGQPVAKDRVRRAVERQGGLAAVIPEDDSASVSRRVASQRRDRARKFRERR